MFQAYWREGMTQEAVFSLGDRHLPAGHNDLLACGLGEALRYLERRRFASRDRPMASGSEQRGREERSPEDSPSGRASGGERPAGGRGT